MPISVVHKKVAVALDGTDALVLYVYGAYGYATDADFDATRLSLLDRYLHTAQTLGLAQQPAMHLSQRSVCWPGRSRIVVGRSCVSADVCWWSVSGRKQIQIGNVLLTRRGVIFAIAHVRGGGDLGQYWHLDGKLGSKRNTFKDTIAAATYLIKVRCCCQAWC